MLRNPRAVTKRQPPAASVAPPSDAGDLPGPVELRPAGDGRKANALPLLVRLLRRLRDREHQRVAGDQADGAPSRRVG